MKNSSANLALRQVSRNLLAVAIFLLVPVTLIAAQPAYVVVGDVHGDFDDFVAILQKAGVVDQENHWRGGDTILVQVGDLIDRGPKPRQVLDYMMSLEVDAKKSGGRVVCLQGNHEVMNLMGDLRYVTPENFASFAEANSEERRRNAWQDFTKWRSKHAALVAELPPSLNPTEAEWMAQHPAGFLEQREAYSPNGKYGKWIRSHSAVAKLNGIVFVHGGLDATMAAMGVDALNTRIHDEINVFDNTRKYLTEQRLILPFFTLQEINAVVKAQVRVDQKTGIPPEKQMRAVLEPFVRIGEWVSMVADSPFWFRGYDEWSEEEGTAQIETILKSCDANTIVVGHTVQKAHQIRSRFGGKVFLIDTGTLSSYFPGGKASALEFRPNGEIAAEYLDQRIVLRPAEPATRATVTQ